MNGFGFGEIGKGNGVVKFGVENCRAGKRGAEESARHGEKNGKGSC